MLYVGANYHPHDWSNDRWEKDIKMMKDASFNIVRLGHLCWDSFEPEEGAFNFRWFDKVMDSFNDARIQVVLDIATRPAPTWLHKKHPSINITDINGNMQDPHSRYMEDVGNPLFQKYAYRFAEKITERYSSHPALLAFGLCNELGAGFVSYSKEVEERFKKWVKHKYKDIHTLNKKWTTQRWSRRLNRFEDIVLPASSVVNASPERYLDLCRFYSDEIIEYMRGLKKISNKFEPKIRESTNHWAEHESIGFDYQKAYEDIIDLPGTGFYPGVNPEDKDAVIGACMIMDHRRGEKDNPVWCLEFQTGTFGGYACPKKVMRMYAYLTLLYCCQSVIAWTWRSMLGGEEQYLFGLLDHDGKPGRKYFEFKQIAKEFKEIEKYQLPRKTNPDIGIAYSFESFKVSQYNKSYYKTDYYEQLLNTYKSLFNNNFDCNIINLRKLNKTYKIIIIPGHCLMDSKSAKTIRNYVKSGGTVVMTAYSAKVNENNQVYDTSMPGLLNDVFGIRANAFERTHTHVGSTNEGGIEKKDMGIIRQRPRIYIDGNIYDFDIDYYEILELNTASSLANFTNIEDNKAAVSINTFGKGTAIYIAIPAKEKIIDVIVSMLCKKKNIDKGPKTPKGVVARRIGENKTIYVNTINKKCEIDIDCTAKSLLTGKFFSDNILINSYDVDLVEMNTDQPN